MRMTKRVDKPTEKGLSGRPVSGLTAELIQAATDNKAIQLRLPKGISHEGFRSRINSHRAAAMRRRGYSMHTSIDRENGLLTVWLETLT